MVDHLPGTEFYFMRHGMTASNDADRIAGFTDEPLTDEGRTLAARQATRLRYAGLGSIWVSTLQRALETAQAVHAVTPLPINALDELRERNWGVWEGAPRAILRRDEKPDGGEGPEEFSARVRLALSRIEGPSPALIVAHSGTAREIFALLDLPFERPGNCDILHFSRNENCRWIVKKM